MVKVVETGGKSLEISCLIRNLGLISVVVGMCVGCAEKVKDDWENVEKKR